MILQQTTRASLIALHIFFYASFALLRNWFVPQQITLMTILAVLLIWISVVDVERFEVPDLAALLLALTGGVVTYNSGPMFLDHVIAGVLWPLLFWAVGVGYGRLRGWQGLGFGDIKLMVGIGLWLGLTDTTLVVFAAAMAGIVAILLAKLINRSSFANIGTTAVAFGPFLCLSAWVIWLF